MGFYLTTESTEVTFISGRVWQFGLLVEHECNFASFNPREMQTINFPRERGVSYHLRTELQDDSVVMVKAISCKNIRWTVYNKLINSCQGHETQESGLPIHT